MDLEQVFVSTPASRRTGRVSCSHFVTCSIYLCRGKRTGHTQPQTGAQHQSSELDWSGGVMNINYPVPRRLTNLVVALTWTLWRPAPASWGWGWAPAPAPRTASPPPGRAPPPSWWKLLRSCRCSRQQPAWYKQSLGGDTGTPIRIIKHKVEKINWRQLISGQQGQGTGHSFYKIFSSFRW